MEGRETGLEPLVPAGTQEPPAQLGLLIDHDHPVACLAGIEGCGDASSTASHDQHLAMGVDLVVPAGVRLGTQPPAAVQPDRLQPVEQLNLRGAKHGVVADMYERVRLLDTCREDAAKTRVRRAVRDHPHVVGQQSRRQGIALVGTVWRAIETEANGTCAVDAAA